MIALVLRYWKFGVGALAGALIMYGAIEVRVWVINAAHALEIESTKRSVIEQCEEDKKLTLEVSNAYQIELSDLNRRLVDLKRVQRDVCVPVADPASGRDASAGAGHVERNGILAGTLYDYAGTAEQYRRQLMACQSFIIKTWEAKKTPAQQ